MIPAKRGLALRLLPGLCLGLLALSPTADRLLARQTAERRARAAIGRPGDPPGELRARAARLGGLLASWQTIIPIEDDMSTDDEHHFNLDGHKEYVRRVLQTMKDRGWFPW